MTDEAEYIHILSAEGRCSCGDFVMHPSDPYFTQHAARHFRETNVIVRREGLYVGFGWGIVITAVIVLVATLVLVACA